MFSKATGAGGFRSISRIERTIKMDKDRDIKVI
jgi:hypothetical protein